jgi:hypothetical protein
MKKILLSLMTICALAITSKVNAQCDLQFNNLVITSTAPPNNLGSRCQYTFDVTFDITTNSGFKYLFLHSWLLGDYPNPSIFNCTGSTPATSPGNVTQLGTTIYEANKSVIDFGFIGLNNVVLPAGTEVDVTANIATTPNYPNNDNNLNQTVALNSATSATVTRDATNTDVLHFEITGLIVEINGTCGLPITVKTDIWGSNATGSQLGTSKSKISAQCYVCAQGLSFNDPAISLIKICGTSPFQYDIGLITGSTTDIHVVYKLYAHDPLLGTDPDPSDPLIFTSGTITLKNTNPYDPAPIALPYPYCCLEPWANWDLYVKVTGQEFSNTISTPIIAQECATLPVNLKSFTATRANSSIVNLKWETAQEENSKGFDVQRKLANGSWQSVSFVETKATNGNSNSPLIYEFADLNNSKGISQYRLRQLDVDGKQSYSLIRSVRGEGQKGKTIVYPNPSGDGKVNIVFEDVKGVRDISVTDMSGRMIKQMKGVTNNNIKIDNLNAGMYTVRVLNVETGEQVVEKFVVNKR